MAIVDTLTTREAVRRAALEDLVRRADIAAVTIGSADAELAALDGLKVISLGKLRDEMSSALTVTLPPPSERHAEVSTPATVTVSAFCPECKLAVKIVVILTPELVVDATGAELKIKAKAKKAPHQHNQLSIDDVDGDDAGEQVGIDELIEADGRKLRILRAVAMVGDRYTDAGEAAAKGDALPPPPTLDAIAAELKLAGEDQRFDLLDYLVEYASSEPALVAVSVGPDDKGPTTYALTDAGSELIDRAEDVDVDQADDEADDQGETP